MQTQQDLSARSGPNRGTGPCRWALQVDPRQGLQTHLQLPSPALPTAQPPTQERGNFLVLCLSWAAGEGLHPLSAPVCSCQVTQREREGLFP